MKKISYILLGMLLISCNSNNILSNQNSINESEVDSTLSSLEEELKPTNLYLVGDSTVCSFDDDYYYPRYGYGTQIKSYLKDEVNVINLALSGRSSKDYLLREEYSTLSSSIKEGDYLMIGFGHNDEKTEEARYTNPNLGVDEEGSFKKSLYDNYVKLALEKGATPILCSPIVRRSASNEYENNNVVHVTTGNATYPGGDYSKAVRELAQEKDIDFVDLTSLTKTKWKESGSEGTLKYHAWLTSSSQSVDNTHLNKYGAQIVSYLLADGIKNSSSSFAKYVKEEYTYPTENEYLRVNPDYKEIAYTAPTSSGKTFVVNEPWWTSVFGDCGGQSKINKTNFDISETQNGVHMRAGTYNPETNAATSSLGKISSSAGDGLAMYFRQIRFDQDFSLSATARINFYDTNNQVGFGIMLRDDMYIDTFLGSVATGDYVAAGGVNFVKGPAAVFSKTTGKLSTSKTTTAPTFGEEINLNVTRSDNVITCSYNDIIYSFEDKNINNTDMLYDYVGLFVSRCVDVDFTNIVYQEL